MSENADLSADFKKAAWLSPYELYYTLESLIKSEGQDEAARNALAAYGFWHVPVSKRIVQKFDPKKPGAGFTAHTDEMGDVHIAETSQKNKQSYELREGTEVRAGHYILSRFSSKALEIEHFWKREIGSQSETQKPPAYRLAIAENGKPLWFGLREIFNEQDYKIPFLLDVTETNYLYKELWGPNPGALYTGLTLLEFRTPWPFQ